ncbi:MAG TPA: histidine kinase [Desulfotomaculum sp.]|nr:Spo0B domain-containing protein [Desulfofundulus thermobenzoicus]HHW45163.1 histidine kinase [Desulfotomaculum sp.]
MELKALLEVIQVQRHDFMNHLQVISGLVQMNKPDRVRDYIREVSREIECLGKIIHLKVPEATAAFLVAHNEAAKEQIELAYRLQCNLAHCTIPGPEIGYALEEAFSRAIGYLASCGSPERRLEVHLQESQQRYTFRLVFSVPAGCAVVAAGDKMTGVHEKLAAYGGKAGLVMGQSEGEIFLVLPRRASELVQSGT